MQVIPSARSSWDVIGEKIGHNLSQTLPSAVNQGYQRQLGLNALGQAEQEIAGANGDPYKIAMAFAKAGAQNPNLERSLGPLMQTAMNSAKVGRAYGPGGSPNTQRQNPITSPNVMQNQQDNLSPQPQTNAQPQASDYPTPTAFNIFTADDINQEAERYANAINDPSGFGRRQAELQNQNAIATQQREGLEDLALKSNIPVDELPMFMRVGSKFDPRNPTEWMIKTNREYKKVKNNFDKLHRAFIPGIGSALMGFNREEELKRLTPTVQDLVKEGFEQEVRDDLHKEFLSPTEVSLQIHPLTSNQQKSIQNVPRGLFPMDTGDVNYKSGLPVKDFNSPFVSYEKALEKAPKEMKAMQNQLADFFMKNIDKNTSIAGIADKLIRDRDYDWRQIGPAIRQAVQQGNIQLEPFQSAELTDIETQPPRDSLPHIFRSMDRFKGFLRGNK